jgi:hypothetical protein
VSEMTGREGDNSKLLQKHFAVRITWNILRPQRCVGEAGEMNGPTWFHKRVSAKMARRPRFMQTTHPPLVAVRRVRTVHGRDRPWIR